MRLRSATGRRRMLDYSRHEFLFKTKLLGVYFLFSPQWGYGVDIGFWKTLEGWKWKVGFMRRRSG